jgi:hypothetical protein
MFKKALENNPELSNIGKKWSKEEESLLLLRIKEKKSHLEISSEFKRTRGGISSRLKDVAVKLYNDNESLEIIEKITGINREVIIEQVNRPKKMNENKNSKTSSGTKASADGTTTIADTKDAEIVAVAYSEALKAGETPQRLTELNKEMMKEFGMRCYISEDNKLIVCDAKGNTIITK